MTQKAPLELFSIDVEAEVRKLSERQFAHLADQLAALFRFAVWSGASSIECSTRGGTVRILGVGAKVEACALDEMEALLDENRSAEVRHEALCQIEKVWGPTLLSLVGQERFSFSALGRAVGRPRGALVSPPSGDLVVEIGADFNARVLRQRLRERCRHSRVSIVVDGEAMNGSRLPRDLLIATSVRNADFDITVGIPRESEVCRTFYIADEILCEESVGSSPQGFSHFAVARDLRARGDGEVRTAELYTLIRHIRAQLHEHLRQKFESLPPADQSALRLLVLRIAERSLTIAPLQGLRIFRTLAGERIAADELRARGTQGALLAVEPATEDKDWIGDPTRILVLDGRERALLAKVLRLSVVEPTRHHPDNLWRRLLGWSRRARGRVSLRLSGWRYRLGRGITVTDDALTPQQTSFLSAIKKEISSGRVRLPGSTRELTQKTELRPVSKGALPVQVREIGGVPRLDIPLAHPLVRAMCAEVSRRPEAVFPAMALLMGGEDGYGERKLFWYRKIEGGLS